MSSNNSYRALWIPFLVISLITIGALGFLSRYQSKHFQALFQFHSAAEHVLTGVERTIAQMMQGMVTGEETDLVNASRISSDLFESITTIEAWICAEEGGCSDGSPLRNVYLHLYRYLVAAVAYAGENRQAELIETMVRVRQEQITMEEEFDRMQEKILALHEAATNRVHLSFILAGIFLVGISLINVWWIIPEMVVKPMYRIAKEAQEASEALAHQASRDPLTGMLNRRAILNHLDKELSHAGRHGEMLAVGMCDIDHFKKVNDTYGHQTGDEVLCGLTTIFRENLRQHDTVGRMGGEEFLVVSTMSAGADCQLVFDRVCRLVADNRISTRSGDLAITLSIGVATAGINATVDNLLEACDLALYQAKVEGRNRVVLAPAKDDTANHHNEGTKHENQPHC